MGHRNWISGFLLTLGLLSGSGVCAAESRYVLISHAPDSDVWWNVIKNAIKQAGEDLGVEVDYRNPSSGDVAEMARLVEQSAARNYSGVTFDISDFSVLSRAAKAVNAKNIPIITLNSGTPEQSKQLGALMHVGQPEYKAAYAAGERAKAAGVRAFVCVNHYAINASSFERCRGFADALGVDAKSSMIDTGTDPTIIATKLGAYLRTHANTQAVLTLGPNGADPSLQMLEKMGKSQGKGRLYFVTFDLSPEIISGIKQGKVDFAIDQQPYLQGYIPIAALVMRQRLLEQKQPADIASVMQKLKADPKFQHRLKTYALSPVYTPDGVDSGPGFVTPENAAMVEKYAGTYR